MSVPASSSVDGPSKKSYARNHATVWLSIALVLILLLTLSPFIVSFAGAGIAGALDCEGTMQISSPCLLMGSDVSQTFTTMIYLGYLGFVAMPFGGFLLAIWVVAACLVAFFRWRRRRAAA